MRTIRFTARFRKDYKRVLLGLPVCRRSYNLSSTCFQTISRCPSRTAINPLKGEWQGFRDCHIRPDLVLIYRKFDPKILELNRIGSHSELFGK